MRESEVVVLLSEEGITCTRPGGLTERVRWDDLMRIEIFTTSEGPWATDVFWVLSGSESGCVVPMGATGEREMLRRLQELSGFDNEAVIQAMGSVDDARFLCWARRD